MDIYYVSNFLDTLNLEVSHAIIIDETTTPLHAAAAATSDGTYLIQTDFPLATLITAAETGVTVYSPSEDRAFHIYADDEIKAVPLTDNTKNQLDHIAPERLLIPIDPYNSIETEVLPASSSIDIPTPPNTTEEK